MQGSGSHFLKNDTNNRKTNKKEHNSTQLYVSYCNSWFIALLSKGLDSRSRSDYEETNVGFNVRNNLQMTLYSQRKLNKPPSFFRWIKEWIFSERPITICAIVKAWLILLGSSNVASVWRHYEIKTNKGSRIVYITEKLAHQHAQNATFGLFAAAGFISTI